MPFRVRHLWAGESHLRFKHKLPSEFEKKAEESPDRHRFTMPPDIFTDYLLTEEVVRGILKEAETFAPGPQVVTICIGSNDLRDHPNNEMALKLLGLFKKLVDGVLLIENAALVLISPIPDQWGTTDAIGDYLTAKMRGLVLSTGSEKVQFCNFREKRLWADDAGSRWTQDFFKDDKHLNRAGAEMLADELLKCYMNLPNRVFGKGPVKGKDVAKLSNMLKRNNALPVYGHDARLKLDNRRNSGWVQPAKRRRRR